MAPPSVILDNRDQNLGSLYLGDYQNATNLLHPEIKKLNIKHVINCCKGGQNFYPNHYNYVNLEWIDNEQQMINNNGELLKVVSYIDNALSNNESVFVHCGVGMSRSATVVIAYIMYKYKWSYEDAFLFVKDKRSIIQPNVNFEMQLNSIKL